MPLKINSLSSVCDYPALVCLSLLPVVLSWRPAYVLVVSVLVISPFISAWFPFESDDFGWAAADSWQPQGRLDASMFCRHPRCLELDAIIAPRCTVPPRGLAHLRICVPIYLFCECWLGTSSEWGITGGMKGSRLSQSLGYCRYWCDFWVSVSLYM